MTGYSANVNAAQSIAADMQSTAATLRKVMEELDQAAATSLKDWNATAQATYRQLHDALSAAAQDLSVKGQTAGTSLGNIMDEIKRADQVVDNIFH
ncbi:MULTISPECIES: WXG100 family type VII secretion target [Amycolatopsis]|uniref:WXG100 family type VII secretion target n=1 Tax=Amycolatopsis albidoflavus TaxID=102226 RepID=A0ABW5I7N3_9PSEU